MRVVFGDTDKGLLRELNEDAFSCGKITDCMCFAVLCDGMGGENGGEVASEIAVKVASEMLRRELKEDMGEVSLRSVLSSAAAGANAMVFEQAGKDEDLAGMGTTLILAVLLNDSVYIASVGDSRAYIVSSRHVRQLTRDHTVVQMLVDIGEISKEEAQKHPKRHYITKVVGVSSAVEPDFIVEPVKDGDILLLCSDGLYNYLNDDSMYELVRGCVEKESAAPLIEHANKSGGTDNITAVVMV